MNITKHNWSKDDYILTFYVTKYGTTGLYLKNDDDVCNFIGTTKGSLTKMKSNFNHLLGLPNCLNHIKNLQSEVFEEYNQVPLMIFRNTVKTIINQDKVELERIFKGMNRNPEKMKKISTNYLEMSK